MIFGKKNKKDPTSPNNNKKGSLPSIQTANKGYRKSTGGSAMGGSSVMSGGGSAMGGSSTAGGESMLSTLSPTSYAQQFDALDQVVAAAAAPVKNNRGSRSTARSECNDEVKNITAPSAIAGRGAESLVKEMDGLKLDSFLSIKGDAHHPTSHTATGKQSTNILDFDNDSDGVFEDDDAMLPSDSNHGSTDSLSLGAGKKPWKGGWKRKGRKKKGFGIPSGTGGTGARGGATSRSRGGSASSDRGGAGYNDHTRGRGGTVAGGYGSGRSADSGASTNSKLSAASSSRMSHRSRGNSSHSMLSVARTDDGRGGEEGTTSASSSSSSSMGDAYDDA
eukprot:CAMPEP_0201901478 /NCGR_PEP_ID=MMETSP0902-20130614/54375_1 /ASSEMBLY_ACC=CAM_ASM_000551 /TAXON_ID=420261 /ORGANISM="Thalassiosira antarctica, Strain CCMP982" /LENGTH=333 /DNA_ID=CAMNT_0048435429 /DNA_START=501 /DNA_END=1499 /DNA_ORIENTATION=-